MSIQDEIRAERENRIRPQFRSVDALLEYFDREKPTAWSLTHNELLAVARMKDCRGQYVYKPTNKPPTLLFKPVFVVDG